MPDTAVVCDDRSFNSLLTMIPASETGLGAPARDDGNFSIKSMDCMMIFSLSGGPETLIDVFLPNLPMENKDRHVFRTGG